MNSNKPRYDILFEDRPMNDGDFINHTFINRQNELLIAETLFSPEKPRNRIYAIHGFSRVGKSHIAMYLMEKFKKEHDMFYFYVNANTKGTAYDILVYLYDILRRDIETMEPVLNSEEYEFLKEYLNEIDKIFYGFADKVALKRTSENKKKLSGSFRGRFPFLAISSGVNNENKNAREESIELNKVNADKLRDILCRSFELLSYITKKKILILIDDLDLLEEIEEGEKQRDLLYNYIKFIANVDNVSVFITTRSQYYIERDKEMVDFLELNFLKENDVKDIYEKRIELYHNNIPIFENDALDMLIKGFRGIIGSFLYECFRLMKLYIVENMKATNNKIDIDLLKNYFKTEVEKFKMNPETESILKKITEQTKENQTEISLPGLTQSHGFIYRVLIPKGYKQTSYEILPVWFQAMR